MSTSKREIATEKIEIAKEMSDIYIYIYVYICLLTDSVTGLLTYLLTPFLTATNEREKALCAVSPPPSTAATVR